MSPPGVRPGRWLKTPRLVAATTDDELWREMREAGRRGRRTEGAAGRAVQLIGVAVRLARISAFCSFTPYMEVTAPPVG